MINWWLNLPSWVAGCLFIVVLGVAAFALTLGVLEIFEGEEATPQPLPTHTFRCPEDADMVVRYGVEPAGMVAFCVYSDDMEAIID